MASEHKRRKEETQWLRERREMEDRVSRQRETIDYLTTTATRDRQKLRKVLIENGQHTTMVASVRNCKAVDDGEICPLSLDPINHSPPPFETNMDEEKPMMVFDTLKPDHRCIQLQCGHRFNAIWILFHFAKKNTFKCPLCRTGHGSFRFQIRDLPLHLAEWFGAHLGTNKPH